jgi:hypothetical protein
MDVDSAAAAARNAALVDTPPEGDVDAGAEATPTPKGQAGGGDAHAAAPTTNAPSAVPASVRDDTDDGLPPPLSLSSQSRVLTPPTSEDMDKCGESSSELSELDMDVGREEAEEDEDIGEIEPDHYWDGGRIPIFKPVSGPYWRWEVVVLRRWIS